MNLLRTTPWTFLYLKLQYFVSMFDKITEKFKSIINNTENIELMDKSHTKFMSVNDIKDLVQKLESSHSIKQSQVGISTY